MSHMDWTICQIHKVFWHRLNLWLHHTLWYSIRLIKEAAALVVQLTNEYIGITTDSNGNGGNFADCYTDVLVFSGSTDITKSSDLKWTITATSGIEGEWDKILHRYTIKNLTTNMGEVVFDLIYMDKLSVSKKFRIAKLKAGADGGQGIQGIPGRDGVDGTSSYIHIKYSPVENPTDEMLTEVPAAYNFANVNNNGNANNNNASNSNGVRPISSACLTMLYADTGNEERRSCPCVCCIIRKKIKTMQFVTTDCYIRQI